jgi:mRNA interferase MazF
MRRGEIYWADLGEPFGTEPGKFRPVVVIQGNLLNRHGHPSTIVCLLTSKIKAGYSITRCCLLKRDTGLGRDSDVLLDQIRAIDNRRLRQHAGTLSHHQMAILGENLKVILEL